MPRVFGNIKPPPLPPSPPIPSSGDQNGAGAMEPETWLWMCDDSLRGQLLIWTDSGTATVSPNQGPQALKGGSRGRYTGFPVQKRGGRALGVFTVWESLRHTKPGQTFIGAVEPVLHPIVILD